MQAVKDLRTILESNQSETSDSKAKISKLEAFLDKQEEKNQELTAQLKAQEKTENELKEKLEELEKKAYRANNSNGDKDKIKAEIKSFEKMIQLGAAELEPEEKKTLRTDVETDGGFLVHPEITSEMIKDITEISPIRQIARVRTTSSKSIIIHRRTGLVQGGWVGECETKPENNSTYGDIEIFVNKLSVFSVITNEMLMDSSFNMETEIMADVAEDFAQKEGAAFVGGDGVKKPLGFTNDSDVQVVNTGVANDITADSIITIAGELKTGYNPMYLMNRKTTAAVRKLKDGNGQYLWQPGLSGGLPNTLNGAPYMETPDMDDIGAANTPIAYGDFARGYTIVDSATMSVIRDQFTLATQGKVRFIFMRRVGGQVVQPEAIKLLTCAV